MIRRRESERSDPANNTNKVCEEEEIVLVPWTDLSRLIVFPTSAETVRSASSVVDANGTKPSADDENSAATHFIKVEETSVEAFEKLRRRLTSNSCESVPSTVPVSSTEAAAVEARKAAVIDWLTKHQLKVAEGDNKDLVVQDGLVVLRPPHYSDLSVEATNAIVLDRVISLLKRMNRESD